MSVFDWIAAHSGDVIVLSGIALVVAAVIMGMLLDKKKGINRQTWENSKKGKAPETTDEEYKNIIDQFIDSQEIIVNLEKEYINKYREFLSDKKIYLIYQAEIKFNRNMMKILQKMDDKNK